MDHKSLEDSEKNIYSQYQNVIAPLIVELEVRDAEYPIEIFNEIRSIFTHLSRFKLQNSEKDLFSAESHLKRAILDCFKYSCISMIEQLNNFRNEYKNVNLGLADNGAFLPKLDSLEAEASNIFIHAKKEEIKKETDKDDLYALFEDAYNAYSIVIKFIDDSKAAILFASTNSQKSNNINIASIIITLISIIIAIIAFFI